MNHHIKLGNTMYYIEILFERLLSKTLQHQNFKKGTLQIKAKCGH